MFRTIGDLFCDRSLVLISSWDVRRYACVLSMTKEGKVRVGKFAPNVLEVDADTPIYYLPAYPGAGSVVFLHGNEYVILCNYVDVLTFDDGSRQEICSHVEPMPDQPPEVDPGKELLVNIDHPGTESYLNRRIQKIECIVGKKCGKIKVWEDHTVDLTFLIPEDKFPILRHVLHDLMYVNTVKFGD